VCVVSTRQETFNLIYAIMLAFKPFLRFIDIIRANCSSLFFFSYWGEIESTGYCGHYWPIVPAPDDR
jgi:hypothetical protein